MFSNTVTLQRLSGGGQISFNVPFLLKIFSVHLFRETGNQLREFQNALGFIPP